MADVRPTDADDAYVLRRAANVLYERAQKRGVVLNVLVRILRRTAERIEARISEPDA